MMPDMQHGRTRGQLLDRIAELEAQIQEIEKVSDFNADRVAELEAALAASCDDMRSEFLGQCPAGVKLQSKLDAALSIGEVHPSWGTKDDFTRGWKECRTQFREALGEKH